MTRERNSEPEPKPKPKRKSKARPKPKAKPTPEYDVFISYSSEDKAWVRGELLQRIEQAGLRVFIDYRDFTRGAASIEECQRGVEECPKTLLVLTPGYLSSEWCAIENIMAQTRDPANRQLRLIPLLLQECEKPLRIASFTHIDFTDGADHDLAWRQLLTALGAPPEAEPAKEPQRDDWFLPHPYPMPPNFTGRADELGMLSQWLNADGGHPLLVLRALGGFGKSALVWHWLTHDVAAADWPRVVWWSFYEGDNQFDHFLAQTLEYLGVDKATLQSLSAHRQVDTLLQKLHAPGTLLVLDGFERALRAFGGLDAAYKGDETAKTAENDCDCISPLAETFLRGVATLPNIRAKVLLTTRLRPRAVEDHGALLAGSREEELRQMQPADAVAFFNAQGIRGTRAEIEVACAPYGYHPLSLRLLAGWIVRDLEQPGDIAAARRLNIDGELVSRQHHVLEVAYSSLTPGRRALLSRIACFRGPVAYATLKTLAESADEAGATLDADLHDLVARGLLHHDKREGRFDLHPIVRRYAYDRLAAPDRSATHTQLRDYFAAKAPPDEMASLDDLAPVIELYYHMIRASKLEEAFLLYRDRLGVLLHHRFGAYELAFSLLLALLPDGANNPPRLAREEARAWTLNMLGISAATLGRPMTAKSFLERAALIYDGWTNSNEQVALWEYCFDMPSFRRAAMQSLAIVLYNLGSLLHRVGSLRSSEARLRRSITLSSRVGDVDWETGGRMEIGRLLSFTGRSDDARRELASALTLAETRSELQAQCVTWTYAGQLDLLNARVSKWWSRRRLVKQAVAASTQAMVLARAAGQARFPVERDHVHTFWLLGAVHRAAKQYHQADSHLIEALERCRRINLVEMEADILIDLARLRATTGNPEEAQRLAEEALVITDRSGYVLQGADAHLELAKLARGRKELDAAKEHARRARTLATCDGPPDYTYKAAYDEAGVLLTELGETP